MSRETAGQTESERYSLRPARFRRGRSDGEGCKRCKEAAIGCRFFVSWIASLAALCALALACWGSEASRAQQPDFGVYARAVEYCRAAVKRPMMLDLDKRVLCFDGTIPPGRDVSSAVELEQNGLFVIRSPGGDVATAIALADLLQDRRATVVVYDYCLL